MAYGKSRTGKYWKRITNAAVLISPDISPEKFDRLRSIANMVNGAQAFILNHVPDSAEQTLAIRSMQQAYSWCQLAFGAYVEVDMPDVTYTQEDFVPQQPGSVLPAGAIESIGNGLFKVPIRGHQAKEMFPASFDTQLRDQYAADDVSGKMSMGPELIHRTEEMFPAIPNDKPAMDSIRSQCPMMYGTHRVPGFTEGVDKIEVSPLECRVDGAATRYAEDLAAHDGYINEGCASLDDPNTGTELFASGDADVDVNTWETEGGKPGNIAGI